MKKVLAFGVFDGLHDGHHSFLKQAKALGDHLTVAVAPTQVVARLKGHAPQFSLDERISALLALEFINEVVAGDGELGTWQVVFALKPDVVAFGYDQEPQRASLMMALKNSPRVDWNLPQFVALRAHKPKKLHASILKKSGTSGSRTSSVKKILVKKKKGVARPVFSARKSVAPPVAAKSKRVKKA